MSEVRRVRFEAVSVPELLHFAFRFLPGNENSPETSLRLSPACGSRGSCVVRVRCVCGLQTSHGPATQRRGKVKRKAVVGRECGGHGFHFYTATNARQAIFRPITVPPTKCPVCRQSNRGGRRHVLPQSLGTGAAQLLTCTGERRSDAVFGNADRGADLLVAQTFEVIEAHDTGLVVEQAFEQTLDFVAIGHALFVMAVGGDLGDAAQRKPAQRFLLQELTHADATGDDCDVRRKAALAAEVAEHREVLPHDCHEDIGAEVFPILGGKLNAARLSGMVDDVCHQAQKPVDEIFPSSRLARETAVEQVLVDLRKRHLVIREK